MHFYDKLSTEKRYRTQNEYLRKKFGKKTIKLSLNAGMSCPNRDGTKGCSGCTYCSASLSGDFSGNPEKSITEQLRDQVDLLSGKWNDCLYIAYFQAGSNTYAPLEKLRSVYEEALAFENVNGIAIGTRADCIDRETAGYLTELSKRTYLSVELGLQTIYDTTAEKINRCHSYSDFLSTYYMLKELGINTGIHIINGLPGETREMMMQTAYEVSRLKPHSVKIHMLHIIKGTRLAEEYHETPFKIMDLEEYIDLVCDQIEIMHPDTVIERITGDGNRETLIAPLWSTNKKAVLNGIDKELRKRETYQGIRY